MRKFIMRIGLKNFVQTIVVHITYLFLEYTTSREQPIIFNAKKDAKTDVDIIPTRMYL